MSLSRRFWCTGAFSLLALTATAAEPGSGLRFELSFPASVRSEPVDGRVFVVITREGKTEPRRQFGKSGGQYRSVPFFGEDVQGLRPGQNAVIDQRTEGYPLDHLSDLPAGDYFVQGVLNLYTLFHRADGHTVKLHMDQWEGQDFPVSPGNLYSEPRKIHLDPRAGGTVKVNLDRKIPPIEVPKDSELVKHVRFESPLLSKFWGRPVWIGATVLLPATTTGNRRPIPSSTSRGTSRLRPRVDSGRGRNRRPSPTRAISSGRISARSSKTRGSPTTSPACST